MTDAEQSAIHALAADVREVNASLIDLRISLERHTAADEARSPDLQEVRLEVFGVDADPSRPGLKGRVDRIERTFESASQRIGYLWVVAAAVLGAIATATVKPFFP